MQTKLSGTYEDMIVNFESLLDQFDVKIQEVGQYERNQQVKPRSKTTSYLNKLKLNRARIKQIIFDMGIMTETQVLDLKDQFDEDYKEAIKVLETTY